MVVFSFQTLDISNLTKKTEKGEPYKYERSFGYKYYPLFDLYNIFSIIVEDVITMTYSIT